MRTGTALSGKQIRVEAYIADKPGEGFVERGVRDSPPSSGHEETPCLRLRAQLVAPPRVDPEGVDRGGMNRHQP